jgi:hypothetical protein
MSILFTATSVSFTPASDMVDHLLGTSGLWLRWDVAGSGF